MQDEQTEPVTYEIVLAADDMMVSYRMESLNREYAEKNARLAAISDHDPDQLTTVKVEEVS